MGRIDNGISGEKREKNGFRVRGTRIAFCEDRSKKVRFSIILKKEGICRHTNAAPLMSWKKGGILPCRCTAYWIPSCRTSQTKLGRHVRAASPLEADFQQEILRDDAKAERRQTRDAIR